jgi:predicted ATPase
MSKNIREGYVNLQSEFEFLSVDYCSLGQSQGYYENLLALAEMDRLEILKALRDVVWDDMIRRQFENARAFQTSLMRSINLPTLTKLIDVLHERAANTMFEFTYSFPDTECVIEFVVDPDSRPPSNIHVVIGRNGVGKTRLLTAISSLLRNGRDRRHGRISFGGSDQRASDQFANLVTVAFSAFDSFELPAITPKQKKNTKPRGTNTGIRYAYVGLKKRVLRKGERRTANKSDADLLQDFLDSALKCLRSSSKPRWQSAMRLLEADPVFGELGLSRLADLSADEQETEAGAVFETASSGHKVALLMISRLVELVSERTLVLIDEPEAHLHPPLVMAVVRALSNLLAHRNGVAILATHSPVVAQEVPKDCVSLLFRSGSGGISVERPRIETFAENVDLLTREVFRLEVTESGHQALIAEAVEKTENMDELVEYFGGRIGAQGRALARSLRRGDA